MPRGSNISLHFHFTSGRERRRHESVPALIAKEIENHIRYSVCVRDVSLYADECHPTLMSVCPRAPNRGASERAVGGHVWPPHDLHQCSCAL